MRNNFYFDPATCEAMFWLEEIGQGVEERWPNPDQLILPFFNEQLYETDITCGPSLSFDDRMRVEEVRARILSGFPGINDLPLYEAPLGPKRLRDLFSN